MQFVYYVTVCIRRNFVTIEGGRPWQKTYKTTCASANRADVVTLTRHINIIEQGNKPKVQYENKHQEMSKKTRNATKNRA